MALTVDEILALYETRGAAHVRRASREPARARAAVRAARASQDGASAELVAAALLHDLGHLLAELPHTLERESRRRAPVPARFRSCAALFGDAVLEPIRLHVDAKRYLCEVDSGYWDIAVARLEAQPRAAGRHFRRDRGRPLPVPAVRLGRNPPAALGRSGQGRGSCHARRAGPGAAAAQRATAHSRDGPGLGAGTEPARNTASLVAKEAQS